MFLHPYVNPKSSFYLQNADLLICLDHKPLLRIFTGNTNSKKCNTWGLEVATITRHVKVQHIEGIASKTQSSRFYHDLDFKDSQQELGTPFKPLPPVKQ